MQDTAEVYSEPSKTSKMKVFAKIVDGYPTNTPRRFHVETTWKRPFSLRFNVESTWCVCRIKASSKMIDWVLNTPLY